MSISNDNIQGHKPPFGVGILCLWVLIFDGIIPFINTLTMITTGKSSDPAIAAYSPNFIIIIGCFYLLLHFGIILSSIFVLDRKSIARKTFLVLFSIEQILNLFYLVLQFPIGPNILDQQLISCIFPLAVTIFWVFFIWYFNRPGVKSYINLTFSRSKLNS